MDFDPSKPLAENQNFLYQITVTPYQDGLPSMSNAIWGNSVYNNRRILAVNLSLKSLFEIAYQYPINIRTILEVKDETAFNWSKQTATCFDLIVPDELGDKRFEIMKQQLSLLYPYYASIEKRQVKVKILKVIDGQKPILRPASGTQRIVSYGGKGLSMKNSGISTVSSFLESQLNIPVIDETGVSGLFDLELPWYHENPKQIHTTLSKIGFELVDALRDIDMLIIRDSTD